MRQIVLDRLDDLSNHSRMAEVVTWKLVDDAAAQLGATEAARLKWRQEGRGVPPAWRIRIATMLGKAGQSIALSDFDTLPSTPGRIAA